MIRTHLATLALALALPVCAFATDPACKHINPDTAGVPYCPENGSRILPDNYPVLSVSISDRIGGAEWVTKFVSLAVAAQPNPLPQFFLNVSEENMGKIRTQILAGAKTAKDRKRLDAALTRVDGLSWNWQQDFYQSFVNPKTGRPQPSKILPYESRGDMGGDPYLKLGGAMQKTCGIGPGANIGDGLVHDRGDFANGVMGGNLEGGPGGTCFVGSDALRETAYSKYAQEVCGSSPLVTVPTTWLTVGHTDEIMSTLRTGDGPCDLVIALASPREAEKVLTADSSGSTLDGLEKSDSLYPALGRMPAEVCEALVAPMPGGPTSPLPGTPAVPEDKGTMLQKILFEPAYAGAVSISTDEKVLNEELKEKDSRCRHITNRQFLDLLHADKDDGPLNSYVQGQMDELRARATAAWAGSEPKCTPKFVEFPALFEGRYFKSTKDGGYSFSIFPNPNNLQQIGKSLIVPDPGNPALRKDLADRIAKLGLKAAFVDSHFAHSQGGNIHCSTNTLRYCRPRKKD